MAHVIIHNRSDLTDIMALSLVQAVMEQGRISDKGAAYCYHTGFTVAYRRKAYDVVARRNKNSDTFIITEAHSTRNGHTACEDSGC